MAPRVVNSQRNQPRGKALPVQGTGSASLTFLMAAQLLDLQDAPRPHFYEADCTSKISPKDLKRYHVENGVAYLNLTEFYDLFFDTRNIQRLCQSCQRAKISDGQGILAEMTFVKDRSIADYQEIPHVYASKLRKQGISAVFSSVAHRVIVTSGKTIYGVLSRSLGEPEPVA